jgi:hypothetical protein
MSETDQDISLHHEIARTIRNPETYLEGADSKISANDITQHIYELSDELNGDHETRPMLDDLRHHDTEYGGISDAIREHLPYDKPHGFDRTEAYIERSLKQSDNVVSYIHEDGENEFELLGGSS